MNARAELRAELDDWASLGKVARLWWRDDDAATATPQLRRLLAVAAELDIMPALAVIPRRADSSLKEALSGSGCCIWQHGYGHDFHVAGEFGAGRPLSELQHDAVRGQVILDGVFGTKGWQRVFVPPNHMLALSFKGLLSDLGYLGLSAGDPLTPPFPHVSEFNAELDVMDWPSGRLLDPDEICRRIVRLLQVRRSDPHAAPLGILTHHLVFDESSWACVTEILAMLRAHPAAQFVPPDSFFSESEEAQVTVVLTSCGRPDLLERTLQSFLASCDLPIRDFLIIEDGPAPSALAEDVRYTGSPFRWLCTGQRRGQIQAIDLAYGLVRSPYIFHCEDDWLFSGSSFMRKSLTILESDPRVLQVWLRALDDTNGHPVEPEPLSVGGVPCRAMALDFPTEEWGTWHGFSWNPGLRRRRDYLLLGSFSTLRRSGHQAAWEIERLASEFYREQGFSAVILADDNGHGHVSHIGWGRRVGDPNDGQEP